VLLANVHKTGHCCPVFWKKVANPFFQCGLVAWRYIVNGAVFIRPGQFALRQFNRPSTQTRNLAGDPKHGKTLFLKRCGLFHVVNVGKSTQPLRLPAFLVTKRKRTAQHPAIGAVCPAQPVFYFIDTATSGCLFPVPGNWQAVIGMNQAGPAVAKAFFHGQARIVDPALVEVGMLAIGLHHPDDLGHRVCEQAKLCFT